MKVLKEVFLLCRIDVTELQVTGMIMFFLSGIFGVQLWSLQVNDNSTI